MVPDKPLNLFYEEPDPDRWILFDRYPRRIIRRLYRGRPIPSGQFLVYYNLIAGLNKLDIPFRLNDYRYIKMHPEETACIIGRDFVLDKIKWQNPIAFGAALGINPFANPDITARYPIKKILVPGQWVKEFFVPYGEAKVVVWPVGIDVEMWRPSVGNKPYDFLIYNKIRWKKEQMELELVNPIRTYLKNHGFSFTEIKYGHYKPGELMLKVSQSKAAIFICEHETQGLAYQQILAADLPILAWDRGGCWQDPSWYPDKIRFKPVTSVPYWDDRCGVKFVGFDDFAGRLNEFMDLCRSHYFAPRDYIVQNLTLEICAQKYVDIVKSINNY